MAEKESQGNRESLDADRMRLVRLYTEVFDGLGNQLLVDGALLGQRV